MSKTPRKRAKSHKRATPTAPVTIPAQIPKPFYNHPARSDTEMIRTLNENHAAQYLADEIANGINSNDVTVKWPADWVEALKEQFAPAWLLKRSPVRYNSVTYTEMEWKTKGQISKYNIRTSAIAPKSTPQ